MSAPSAPGEPMGARDPDAPLRILFLARQLRIGGAERQLCLVARGLAERGHRVAIALFYRCGELERELDGSAVELIGLGKSGRYELISTVRGLDRIVQDFRPDILHGYLQIPNLLTLSQLRRSTRPRIVWGVRASTFELSRYDRLTRLSYRLEARLAGLADLIIANSRSGLTGAVQAGFPKTRTICIPNGVDGARFRPDPASRDKARRSWRVGPNEVVVGAVARIDPMKDFNTFLRAVAIASQERPGLRAVALAVGGTEEEAQLALQARELGIADRLLFLEAPADVPEILNGFDLYCSTSAYGEGSSNTVAEAMACAVPCIVTDVGDSAEIVGTAGRIVPPRDPEATAAAILELAGFDDAHRQSMGERLRERSAEFTPDKLVRRTEQAFREVLRQPPSR